MSAFGARCVSAFLLSVGVMFAVDGTGIRWLKICSYVVCGGCLLMGMYAALWDADIV